MNGRSTLATFFIFLLLIVMIGLQVLSMMQSDRLYERLNHLLDILASGSSPGRVSQRDIRIESGARMGQEYPGDEGDWLVQHLLGEPRTLNPISVESSMASRSVYARNIFETLFYYDLDADKVTLKPVLAESMQLSENGLELTVKLRNDIYFSDGVPVTADDVLFSYKTIMHPGVDASNLRNYYQNIKDVVKIDQRTIKFIFSELYWQTLESVGLFEVMPKHIYDFNDPAEFNSHRSNPVGSGPYVFEKWDIGRQIVLRRNGNYWGQKPKIKKIVFRIITNNMAALQALRSHEVDAMEPSSEQFADMSADEKFNKEFHTLSYWEPSGGYSFIGWNQNTPFFGDKRVRLAMTYVIDRNAIVKYISKGLSKVVSGPFYLYGRQNDPNIKPWPYDPEKAKQLLDEAGWIDRDGDGIRDKDGVKFSFKYSYSSGSTVAEQIGKLLKDEAAKIGVDVVADPLEWSIFTERLNARQFEAATLGWGGTIESDPYQIWHSSQIQGRGSNFVGFSNPEADKIIEEARRALEEDKRYALYHRLHRILHEEQPYTFLVSRPTFLLLDKRVENAKIHKLGVDALEWYVPKEKQRYK